MGGTKQKSSSDVGATRRRLHLIFLFCCAVFLFILILLWQALGETSGIYASLANLLSKSEQVPARSVSANSIQTNTITYDKISPQAWEQAANTLASLVLDKQATNSYLGGLYVSPNDMPDKGDISGTFESGLSIDADAVVLGTDTTGDYVSSVIGGAGLSGAANGEGAQVVLDVKAGAGISVDATGVSINTVSGGGLIVSSGGLLLLNTCSDGQLLKWQSVSSLWACASDNAGAGALTVNESDGSPSISPVSLLEFGPATNASDEFVVTDQGGGIARIRTGTAVPLSNAAATISGSWTYGSQIVANGGLSCADCIALGSETTGNYLAGLLAGSGLSVSGSGSEGASLTVSLDVTNANAWTGVQTFMNGFILNSNTYTNLAGTGLSFSSGTLSAALGTSIDSSEITDGTITMGDIANNAIGSALILDGTIAAADIADGTLTLAKLGQNSCAANQIIKWNGLAWACAADVDTDTNTTYSAGSGLSLAGTIFSLDSSLAMFRTIDASLGTDPVADSLIDTLALSSGDGIDVTGDSSTDTVSFSLKLATSSGLAISGAALTLLNTCSNGQYLAWTSGSSSWGCASIGVAPNVFQTIAGDSGSAVADAASDTVTIVGGNGLTSTGSDVADTVTFNVDLASGSGLTFSSGALTLLACSDGQILKHVAGSWACAADADTMPANAYKQQLTGTDNVAVGSSLTPLLTDGSGTAQSLGITVTSGNEVSLAATVEISSSLVTGPVTYVVIRDDNHDNDCVTGGGDGTQIGGQATSFLASITQSFTTTITFADSSPAATTSYYQLCASTTIGTGTTTVTDRALTLNEINL